MHKSLIGQARSMSRGSAIDWLENALLPMRCVFCGTECRAAAAAICAGCYADLPWNEQSCTRCAQPVATILPPGVHCADCQLRPPPFIAAVAPLRYSFPVDAAIKALKFRRRLFYVPAFGELLHQAVQQLPDGIDAVLPVPLHWQRHALRGFNQAAELCKEVRKSRDLPELSCVLRKRATPYQSGLNAKERRRNLRSAFAVRGEINARHVLIVDDVITTGETCRQLAKLLLEYGVQDVSVVAVAHAATRLG